MFSSEAEQGLDPNESSQDTGEGLLSIPFMPTCEGDEKELARNSREGGSLRFF